MRPTALLLLLVLGSDAALPHPVNKPIPPIDLEARIEGDPAGAFTIIARAGSSLEADVRAEVLLPDGVLHLGGVRSRSGREVGLLVAARSPDASRNTPR